MSEGENCVFFTSQSNSYINVNSSKCALKFLITSWHVTRATVYTPLNFEKNAHGWHLKDSSCWYRIFWRDFRTNWVGTTSISPADKSSQFRYSEKVLILFHAYSLYPGWKVWKSKNQNYPLWAILNIPVWHFNDIFLFKNVWLSAGVSIAEGEKRMKTNKTLQTIKKTRAFCDSWQWQQMVICFHWIFL